MKRVLLLILCAGVAAIAAFLITRCAGTPKLLPVDKQLAWLEAEFHLSPAQIGAIKILHEDYQPVCEVHCQKIQEAKALLVAGKRDGGEVAAGVAQTELRRIEAVCRDATREHLQKVAAVMGPEEGERFLALVLPKLSSHTHDAPSGLQ
jgi:hypothetical protein